MPLWRRNQADDLRRVYRENVRAVFAFFAYSVSRHHAEDLTAATFERVVRSWDRYDPERASERSWILAIARNLLTDHFRRGRQELSIDEHPETLARAGAVPDTSERVLTQDQIRSWLEVLGERERAVLALRYAGDLTAEQIGAILELSAANVHQIISRSLRRLREHSGAGRGVSGSV